MGHYLNNMGRLADQWTTRNYKDPKRQRLYLKDIDCPRVWHDRVKDIITPGLFYFNDCTGDLNGPGSVMEPDPSGHGMKRGKGIAKAGDLMSCLPPEMRAENLMCYIGHEGTYTPAHREMCASLGQNIMVEASTGVVENGLNTKPGSSIWFMTETKERQVVSEYWLSTLGHDIEVENHFAQINAWKAAPFKTYIVEQKVGDFILIPPLAPHQVWNRGTRTMKVAWNRTTVETLEMALDEALPRARVVCRDEQYKNKAIIYYSLSKYSALLKSIDSQKRMAGRDESRALQQSKKIRQLQKDFKRLFGLYTRILLSESFSTDYPDRKSIQFLPFDSNVTCGYCRCNIFNRFLTCPSCVSELDNGDEDAYDICMECYAMGRSCACISRLKWVEQFSWDELVEKHETWRHQIIAFEGEVNEKTPQSLHSERENLGKKTLAHICQLELKRRPWNDITKPKKDAEEEEEVVDVDDEGRVRKKRKIRRSEKWQKEHANCHICRAPEPKWKLATCHTCGTSYCYGSLFRAFDLMPPIVLEDLSWKCPKCLMICSCSTCRKDPAMHPFQPAGTMLGHDTSKVADPRSVESLVNFSLSNITWLKKAGDDHPRDTRRLKRWQQEAAIAKSRDPLLGDDYVDHDAPVEVRLTAALRNEFPLDPLLGSAQAAQDLVNENLSPSPERILNDPPQFVAPNQLMYHTAFSENFERGISEGITYVYPDPDDPQCIRLSSPQPELETVTRIEDSNTITLQGGRKRKKLSERDKTHDVPESCSRLELAELGGRPQVAQDGENNEVTRSLMKLSINKSKLATLKTAPSQNSSAPNQDRSEVVIQSDLKSVHTVSQETLPQTLRAKVRLERDDEFKPRKDRKDRRKSGLVSTSRTSVTYVDALELSDEGANLLEETSYSSIRNHSRSDSKWLRMRKGSDEEESSTNGANSPATDAISGAQISSKPLSALPTRGTNQGEPVLDSAKQNDHLQARRMAISAERMAEQIAENRRAKMEAMRWAEVDLDLDLHRDSHPASNDQIRPSQQHKLSTMLPSAHQRAQANGTAHHGNGDETPERQSSQIRGAAVPPVSFTSVNESASQKAKVKNAIRPSRGRGGSVIGRGNPRAPYSG
jgi:hypothetical protein